MIHVMPWNREFSWLSVAHLSRLATTTHKKLILASWERKTKQEDSETTENVSQIEFKFVYTTIDWSGVT